MYPISGFGIALFYGIPDLAFDVPFGFFRARFLPICRDHFRAFFSWGGLEPLPEDWPLQLPEVRPGRRKPWGAVVLSRSIPFRTDPYSGTNNTEDILPVCYTKRDTHHDKVRTSLSDT